MPLAAVAAIGAIGSIGGAAIGSHGAGKAADTQAKAGLTAAQLQAQSAQQALDFQKQQYADSQRNAAPFLQAGQGGISQLSYLLGIGPQSGIPQTAGQPQVQSSPSLSSLQGQNFNSLTSSGNPQISPNQQTTAQWKAQGVPFQNILTSDGRTVAVRTDTPAAAQTTPAGPASSSINPDLGAYGSLSKGWDQTFQAPTNVTEQNDPGFQFRLQQGQQALERSAAARGGLLSGGTAKALTQYGQDYASNEYGNVYNRALGEYQQGYNQFQNNQANQFNRLAALSGVGQTAVSQLNSAGQAASGNVGNILMSSAAQQGNDLQNAAAARASGYASSGNLWGNAISGLGSNISDLLLLSKLKSPTSPYAAGA